MVNYCCVKGCGRNTRTHPNLTYYSLPREKERQSQWLTAAHREDLLKGKDLIKPGHRICSRHFEVNLFKNRNRMLCPTATPTLCLDGEDKEEESAIPLNHEGFECDNCQGAIMGFRYRCVECEDYDLCHKCEVNEYHSEHFVLRIPRPDADKKSNNLRNKLKKELQLNTQPETDSSDDEPIQKYKDMKQNGISKAMKQDGASRSIKQDGHSRVIKQDGDETSVNTIELDKDIKTMLQLHVNMAFKRVKEGNKGVYRQYRHKKRNC